MPIIEGLESTTIAKAFVLNAIATTAIVFTAVFLKARLSKFEDIFGRKITKVHSTQEIVMTLLVTFLAAIITYTLLYYIFGFGYGMLKC